MTTRTNQILKIMSVLLLAVAVSFGAKNLRAAPALFCEGDPGEIGYCPPFTNSSCDAECFNRFGTFGECDINGCCICALP